MTILEQLKKELRQETVMDILSELEILSINNDTRITFAFIDRIAGLYLPIDLYHKVIRQYDYLNKRPKLKSKQE